MGAYSYVALDARGRQKKGLIEGDTPRMVRGQLRERGLTPIEVQQVEERERRGGRGGTIRGGISGTALALLTRQLATLVRSGLPLEESLSTVAQQIEGRRVQGVVMGVRARVVEGHTLAKALGEFPHIFNDLYCATVEAGEHSGHLDLVLERLADYVERRQELQKTVFAALTYPIILIIASVTIVGFLLANVVPQVTGVFANLDAELPPLTQGLIATSDFLRAHWLALGLFSAGLVVGFQLMLRQQPMRFRWHRLLLRLPLIGRVVRGVNAARFTRTFSILVSSGVPVLDAMQICGQVVQNLPMKTTIENAAHRVREGAQIARSLSEGKLFPPITLNLIANGESSGQLDEMLERAAVNQEREVETIIAAVMGILGPMLILMMAGLVLTIVLAIMLPIFELNSLVS